MIDPDPPRVVAYARGTYGFTPQVFEGLAATVPLADVGVTLPLAELYARVTFEADDSGNE